MDSGCKGCTRRYIGCHSECEQYLAARREQDKILEMKYEDKQNERTFGWGNYNRPPKVNKYRKKK